LAGYAVECALKACIARQVNQGDFPDLKTVRDSYVHDLEALIRVAGLNADLLSQMASSPAFALNWGVVKDWSEQSRYADWTEDEARLLIDSIGEGANGVLQWLRSHW
jgi:hypothetical protein